MHDGLISDIKRFALNDGPGIRTTIFLKGCPLHCFWCHNPEAQSSLIRPMYYRAKCIGCGSCAQACPHKCIGVTASGSVTIDRDACDRCGLCAEACPTSAIVMDGRKVSVDDVMRVAAQDRIFYEESGGGITLSGGEPLAQPDFAVALAEACREANLHVALDTSGYAAPDRFLQVASVVDLVLYDIKAVDAAKHREGTGASNEIVLENLRRLVALDDGPEVVIRYPLVPGFNAAQSDLQEFLGLMKEVMRPVELIPFHRLGLAKYEAMGMRPPARALEVNPDQAQRQAHLWQQKLTAAGVECSVLHSSGHMIESHAQAS